MRPAWLTTIACLLVSGCSPLIAVNAVVRLPPNQTVEATQLTFEILEVTRAGTDIDSQTAEFVPVKPATLEPLEDGLHAEIRIHGYEVTFLLRVWADLDGDGVRGPGDLVAELTEPVTGVDHGVFRGNEVHTPDLVLVPYAQP